METITVHKHGPIFDGRAGRAVTAYLDVATKKVAEEGVHIVRQQLQINIKHSTGYVESRVTTDRSNSGNAQVTGGGVIYGPWLEGVSTRNQATRFKGYHSFRKATALLQHRAADIAGPTLHQFLERMQ